MPRPYIPPLARPAQAVQSARRGYRRRWRGWWLLPLLGLLPVVVAVAVASGVRFGAPGGQTVATGPLATNTTAPQAALTATPAIATSSGPTQAATNAAASQPSAAQPTPGTTTQPATVAASSPNAGAAPGASTSGNAIAVQGSTTTATGPFRAYAVQPGDTVKFVAQMYGVSPASISQASGLPNPDRLRVGQVLTIPIQPGWLYRVQPGETLDQIAARTGVATEIIVSASKLATDTVRAGDVILIPEQTSGAGK